MRRLWFLALALLVTSPGAALAWGYEGHEIIAAIARANLTPSVRTKVDALLSTDADSLTPHDMIAESTWADAYRGAGHKETAAWHYVDIELDHPDLKAACSGFPSSGPLASRGPAEDCIVDKIQAFSKELADPATAEPERLLALKYLLHFVGDLSQPLHAADNHDRGGNCVLLALGGPRTVNLHSYWDTSVVEALGSNPQEVAARLASTITPQERARWSAGDARSWAEDSYALAKATVYTLGSKPGCEGGAAPIAPPPGYAEAAAAAAAIQLQKAGLRLAAMLNRDLGG
jgi:hypothetical protein